MFFLLTALSAFAFDLDHDGADDLAVFTPYEESGANLGMLSILSGSSAGLVADADDYWLSEICDMPSGATFGAVTSLDLLDNGYDDLIVLAGVPYSGDYQLYAILGGYSGVTSCWTLDVEAEVGIDASALAVGDFNDDGSQDLAFGSWDGLAVAYGPLFSTVEPVTDAEGVFQLAAGDFNGDGVSDLAGQIGVGSPEIVVWHGSRSSGMYEVRTLEGDGGTWWGTALAAGDFNGDGVDDLAVSNPSEPVYGCSYFGTFCGWDDEGPGYVAVFRGATRVGLSVSPVTTVDQDSAGVAGTAENGDGFGSALAVADWNLDGRDDLAIGVPDEDGGETSEGALHVLYGSSTTLLTGTGSVLLTQSTSGVDGLATPDERFGHTLAVGDYNDDGRPDLAVGADHDDVAGAGAVHVLLRSASGFSTTTDRVWSQDSIGVTGTPEAGDGFGNLVR